MFAEPANDVPEHIARRLNQVGPAATWTPTCCLSGTPCADHVTKPGKGRVDFWQGPATNAVWYGTDEGEPEVTSVREDEDIAFLDQREFPRVAVCGGWRLYEHVVPIAVYAEAAFAADQGGIGYGLAASLRDSTLTWSWYTDMSDRAGFTRPRPCHDFMVSVTHAWGVICGDNVR